MAFDNKRLTSQNVTPYQRVAHYSHPTDNQAAIRAGGYFNSAAKALPLGTIIHAVGVAASAPVLCSYLVTGNTGTVVTVALQTTT